MFRYNEVTMRTTASLLLRLVCSMALLFSALPTRAGVVCVENGRVVARCAMASIPKRAVEKAAKPSHAMARMACCRSKPAAAKRMVRADACPTHKGTRCAYAYRSGPPAISAAKALHLDAPLVLIVATVPIVFNLPPFGLLLEPKSAVSASDSDPPRFRPRSPERSRAPPVA